MEVLGGGTRKQYRLVIGQQLEPFVKEASGARRPVVHPGPAVGRPLDGVHHQVPLVPVGWRADRGPRAVSGSGAQASVVEDPPLAGAVLHHVLSAGPVEGLVTPQDGVGRRLDEGTCRRRGASDADPVPLDVEGVAAVEEVVVPLSGSGDLRTTSTGFPTGRVQSVSGDRRPVRDELDPPMNAKPRMNRANGATIQATDRSRRRVGRAPVVQRSPTPAFLPSFSPAVRAALPRGRIL